MYGCKLEKATFHCRVSEALSWEHPLLWKQELVRFLEWCNDYVFHVWVECLPYLLYLSLKYQCSDCSNLTTIQHGKTAFKPSFPQSIVSPPIHYCTIKFSKWGLLRITFINDAEQITLPAPSVTIANLVNMLWYKIIGTTNKAIPCSACQYYDNIVYRDIYFLYRLQIAISSYHISIFL